MYIVKSESNDPYFNFALEEYCLKNFEEEFFITAINEPSIIVGLNQNSYQEINALYVKQNNIKVVRRLSGGGTVFQDHGNINFSYIYKDDGSDITDFTTVCETILKFVKEKLELEAEFAGRNDLIINNKKFSGHARLKSIDKILHHGTLLVSSNMSSLTNALKFNDNKYADRALRSNHERVTNLSEHTKDTISTEKVFEMFNNFVRNEFPESEVYNLSKEDIDAINKLVKEKYSTWDWNYGHEVDIPYYKTCNLSKGNFDLFVDLDENIIKSIKIFGDFFSQEPISTIEDLLTGVELSENIIKNKLTSIDFESYMSGITVEDFIKSLFN